MKLSHVSRRGIVGSVLLVAAICMLLPAVAQTQSRAARVFLVTFEPLGEAVPSVVVSQINRELIERLSGVRNLTLMHRAHTADQPEAGSEEGASRHNAAIAQAEQAYQAGVGLYVVEDFTGAVAALSEMQSLFEDNAADVRNWDMMVDGMARLAECQFKLGDVDASRETLFRALTLRPSYEVDPERSGIAFGDLYTEVAADVVDSTAGELRVTTDLEEAAISVDGLEVGQAPVTVPDLRPGEHFIVARGASGEIVDARVVLDARRDTEVELTLTTTEAEVEEEDESGEPRYLRRLRAEIREDHIGEPLRPYLQELATRQGVDFVVIGVVMDDGAGYMSQPFIYRAEDGRFGVVDRVIFDVDMSAVAVNVYALSQNIANAVRGFPDELVTGAPLLAAPVAEVDPGAGTNEPEFVVPEETTLAIPAPVVVPAAVAVGVAASGPDASTPAPDGSVSVDAEVPSESTVGEPVVEEQISDPVPPDEVPIEEPRVDQTASLSDPVPPELQTTPQGQAPPAGYYSYPPPSYSYPPSTDGEVPVNLPPGYYYYGGPPPEGDMAAAPPPGTRYDPPPGYSYPPPAGTAPDGQVPVYPPPQGYGAPPQGSTYPPSTGYPAYGSTNPGYGYPPAEGDEGAAASAYGYPPPSYGYPPPDEQAGVTDPMVATAYTDGQQANGDIIIDNNIDDDDDTPLYKEWWLWAGVGGATIIIVTTVAVLAGGDSGGESGFQTEVRW